MNQNTHTLNQRRFIVRAKKTLSTVAVLFFFSIHTDSFAEEQNKQDIDQLCREIGSTLGSVSIKDCKAQKLSDSGQRSIEGRPLSYKFYPPLAGKKATGKILLMGGWKHSTNTILAYFTGKSCPY